jgi:hypothetical protein
MNAVAASDVVRQPIANRRRKPDARAVLRSHLQIRCRLVLAGGEKRARCAGSCRYSKDEAHADLHLSAGASIRFRVTVPKFGLDTFRSGLSQTIALNALSASIGASRRYFRVSVNIFMTDVAQI